MRAALIAACLLSGASACSRVEERTSTESVATGKGATTKDAHHPEAAQATSETFGTPAKIPGPPLDVERVLAAPTSYLKQTIKCQGTVSRVCEAAGCWLELRADAGGTGLRVPMAGHSFFVPQRIVGKKAVVEGTLSAQELSETQLAHLRGEGLQATGPLFLAATSVTVTSETSNSR